MRTVIFLGICIHRAEIPIETWSSFQEFKFSTPEKISQKLTSLLRIIKLWGYSYGYLTGSGINCIGADVNIAASALDTADVPSTRYSFNSVFCSEAAIANQR